ncbi:MAG: photosynthetic complex putative assembly protein PuhB [Pseudomonadota bacterium]
MTGAVPRVSVLGSKPANEESAEAILWEGQPTNSGMFWRAFGARWIALYLAVLLVYRVVDALGSNGGTAAVTGAIVSVAVLTAILATIIGGLAYLTTRASAYTITDRRVIIDLGVALPMRVDVPIRLIQRADLLRHSDGSGDIVFTLTGEDRAKYFVFWPHVRPFRWLRVQPTLRSIVDIDGATRALATASGSQPDVRVNAATVAPLATADSQGVVAG